MNLFFKRIIAISPLLFSSALYASETASETEAIKLDAVTTSGIKDADWKPYASMLKGMDAYDKFKYHAPTAPLKFIIRPEKGRALIPGLALRIEDEGSSIAVPIAEDGTFILPRDQALADKKAEMVLNQKKGYLWTARILSANSSENAWRLGDMRLQCEVMVAINKDSLSFIARTALLAIDPCHSSLIHLVRELPPKSNELIAVYAGKREKVELSEDKGKIYFRIPLENDKYPDDTFFEIQYPDQTAAK
ncbi:hypothetical protein [Iodobacter fluviatilis]|uniref:Uncharacterized protein n=1 Tax=Iodobacter fluviatilis TaxID=537 RepID=A0A377SW53_9NEIS|nr:hypothetical protein [Iodobacter fluviatilis]TCU88125.1 hypothetical protein EV682_104299 [Iodobacter fluviatilis]STR45625.1 Uncharacterised protein [Iodobacter fluviatilis]